MLAVFKQIETDSPRMCVSIALGLLVCSPPRRCGVRRRLGVSEAIARARQPLASSPFLHFCVSLRWGQPLSAHSLSVRLHPSQVAGQPSSLDLPHPLPQREPRGHRQGCRLRVLRVTLPECGLTRLVSVWPSSCNSCISCSSQHPRLRFAARRAPGAADRAGIVVDGAAGRWSSLCHFQTSPPPFFPL